MVLPHDDVGSGPAIVLVHAGVADRTMWREHLEPLAAAGHRAVAVDVTGFGEAPLPDGEDVPWADVLATMDALGIDRATLVGVSYGAGVVLRAALVAPARATSLVLVSASAPGADPSPALRAVWDAEEAAIERGDVDAAVAVVVDAWTLPDAPPALRERVAAMQRRAYELQVGVPEPDEPPDPLGDGLAPLAALDLPVLVVVGERDKPDFAAAADALAGALPQARVVVAEGAGHLAPLEVPERFRALLLDFAR